MLLWACGRGKEEIPSVTSPPPRPCKSGAHVDPGCAKEVQNADPRPTNQESDKPSA